MLAPRPPRRSFPRVRWAAPLATAAAGAAVGAVGVLLAGMVDRSPANPHRPAPFPAAPPRRTASLGESRPHDGFRLVTWNIHHATGADGVRDPARTAAELRASRFDVALLQEVDGPTAGAADQAAALAADLRVGAAFVGTERRWGRVYRGNGVLTRLPAGPLHRVPLPDTRGKGFRTLTLATVRTPAGTPVRVVGVHVSRGEDKAAQLAAAVDLFFSLAEPCVLAGDFNTKAGDDLLADLRETPGVVDALAGLKGERWEVEQVFARGLKPSHPARVGTDASDHPLIAVDLRVPRRR